MHQKGAKLLLCFCIRQSCLDAAAWKHHHCNSSKALDHHQPNLMLPWKAPLEEVPVRWGGNLWWQALILRSARHLWTVNRIKHPAVLLLLQLHVSELCSALFQRMKLWAVLTLLQRNLDPWLLFILPLLHPCAATAALYHFSWLTLFSTPPLFTVAGSAVQEDLHKSPRCCKINKHNEYFCTQGLLSSINKHLNCIFEWKWQVTLRLMSVQ